VKWKKRKKSHLILFDDTCSLCWRSVNRVLAWDKKKAFQFLPLRDPDAKLFLGKRYRELKNANTLVLIENYRSPDSQIWIRGRGVMRVLWLLGGLKRIPGLLCFVPLGIDAAYALIAKRRHRL
jgi:predicted DCC family thiol-disulfide oxidoreductase YuxK